MTDAPIVSLRDVGKRYVKYEDVPTLISGVARRRWRNRRSKLWAVRHVNLEVARGEAVGVIGRNGAGTSTMLAMLAGVTAPTEGVVSVRGRVAPLLRLGVGFHDELTGRENVYINASVLGLTETQIDGAFDEIVSFAELEEFIDTPVKFYSSGMQARLGFAVAVASQPDVLIVDEVLAVGDLTFQMRSFDRMLELQDRGATILVVSHNLESIRRVCSRALIMNKGEPYFQGPVGDAIDRYHEFLGSEWSEGAHPTAGEEGEAISDAPVQILKVQLLDDDGFSTSNFESGSTVTVRMHVRFTRDTSEPIAGLWVTNQANLLIYRSASDRSESGDFEAGSEVRVDVHFPLPLAAGTYTLGSWIGWGRGENFEHVRAEAIAFYVSSLHRRGVTDLGAIYTITSLPAATDSPEVASDPRAL